MALNIKITNSEITGQSSVLNNLKINSNQNVDLEIADTKINDMALVLDNMSDIQIDDIINQLTIQAQRLGETEKEYAAIQELLTDIKKSKYTLREALKKHLPSLLIGTLSNIISELILR